MHLEEFKQSVFPLKSRLYRFARWMVQNHEDAEDIVQEIFLKLWSMRHTLKQYTSIEALAMQMTKNLCLNKVKSHHLKAVDITQQHLANRTHTPDQAAELTDTRALMDRIIARLPPQQRLVVQLRDVEELEIEEIAQLMDLTVNNIRATLSIARKKIRELYKIYYGYEGE